VTKPKLILFGDPKRRHAAEAVADFIAFADGKAKILANCFDGSCSVEKLKAADFAVVFGGDGTILSAARDLCQADVPVIGVNVGKLGFLAEFSIDELKQVFERIVIDDSLIEKRMILKCVVYRDGKEKFSHTIINDMVIAAGEPFNMVELKMSLQGQALAGFIGDGVIICTPTGSTAYNLSAGGPILSAGLSAIVITALCPHSLSFRPIVISSESVVRIEPVRVNEGTTILFDGRGKNRTHNYCGKNKNPVSHGYTSGNYRTNHSIMYYIWAFRPISVYPLMCPTAFVSGY